MNIARWLAQAARRWPDARALATGEREVATYRDFAATAAAVGAVLRDEHGVEAGDRVVLYLSNSTRYLEALFAIWWLGATAVPVNYKLHAAEVSYIVDDVEPVLVLASPRDCERLQAVTPSVSYLAVDIDGWSLPAQPAKGAVPEAPVDRAPDDCAWIFYSSGTTGKPKGVMLSNDNLVAMSLTYLADVDDIGPNDVSLYAAPISHGAGLYCLVHVLRGSLHVVPESGGFDAHEVLALAERWGEVSMFAAPTMVRRLVSAARGRPAPGDGFKTVVYGGGPMYLADIQEAIEVMGGRFAQIYGQAESPMTITVLDRADHARAHANADDHILASVGRAQSSVAVRVTAEDGRALAVGEVGEVEVRGPTTMLGYWRNLEATSQALHDGWLRTGDLGSLDHDGWVTLVGRAKEVVISGGTNIYPREVEDVLVAHPGVSEAAVVGVPDSEWGEVVVAFVVPTGDAELNAADLDRHCLEHVARFKRPRTYQIVSGLPKNNNGKVVKSLLLAQIDGAPTSAETRPRTGISHD